MGKLSSSDRYGIAAGFATACLAFCIWAFPDMSRFFTVPAAMTCFGFTINFLWSEIVALCSRLSSKRRWAQYIAAVLGTITYVGLIALLIFNAAPRLKKTRTEMDKDYVYYRVDILNSADFKAPLPIWIATDAPSPFQNVDPWWSPWGTNNPYPKDRTNPYWSIGFALKVYLPNVSGTVMYGPSIRAGDYQIEYDTTYKGLSYHFMERLNIRPHDGYLIQSIDVWRTIGKERVLVFSDHPEG